MNVKSKFVLVLLILLCSCNPRYGFIESEFQLSSESRLPKWVDIPSGYSRKDLTMTITFYTHPFLNKVKMVVYDTQGKVINEKIGDQCYHPLTKKQPRDAYPCYIIVSVNGIKEVFEHRVRGPILWITDDPQIVSKAVCR